MANQIDRKCNINELPEELRTAKRFFSVAIINGGKVPLQKQWNNPEKQRGAAECKTPLVGFDICGHESGADYVVFDFDHVLDGSGSFTSAEAETVYNKIMTLIGGTWAEVSISGSGVHIVGRPTPEAFQAITNNAEGVLHLPEGGRVEIFYKTAGRYFIFTGFPFRGSVSRIASGESVDTVIEWIKGKISAQLSENRKETAAKEAAALLPETLPDSGEAVPDHYRVKAMLRALPCSQCTYTEWVNVGMIIHDTDGLSFDDWEEWSAADSERYKGRRDLETHWKSFSNTPGGVSIGTLYGMAVRYGYDAKATARQWYREHEVEDLPFADLGEEDHSSSSPDYCQKCRAALSTEAGRPALEFLRSHDIDPELAIDHGFGFDPKSDPAGNGHPEPRIIVPTSEDRFLTVSISPDTPEQYQQMNPKGSSPDVFNVGACYEQDAQEVFIVPGVLDALSILSAAKAGERQYSALSLNNKTQAKRLIDRLKSEPISADKTFILSLSTGEDRKELQSFLARELRYIGASFIQADITSGAKTIVEAWTRNKQDFMGAVENALTRTAARPDNVSLYIDNFMGEDIEHFKQERKTGFPSFDMETGGLYPGLYVLAAISSLGKTSFALQMADQLAASGEDVLFFSLEMSRLELVSKSLARTISQDTDKRITSMEIRKGRITQEVMDAAKKYKETVGERLSIVEANFDLNISSICDYVRRYIEKNNTRPAVFLDYLQILQPKEDDSKKQRREALDNTVTELKRFSREIDAPIFVISSVNRANYATPIAFESLKESGGIEYSADVVLGMQLQCLREDLFNSESSVAKKRKRIDEEKVSNPRKIELVCLKNRFGVTSFSCYYEYFPGVDLFVDMGKADPSSRTSAKRRGVVR